MNKSIILPGETITGTAIIQNIGNAAATNFIFRYYNCDAILGEETIATLNPGESLTYTFSTTTNVIGDCFNTNNCLFQSFADVNNQVTEQTKVNNVSSAYLTVLPDKPDLTPINTTNLFIPGNINMLSPFIFNVRVDNIGGVNATSPFTVNVYMDGVVIHTESINGLATCAGHTFSVTHNFASILDHVLAIRVDEPLGTGAIDEYRETNNAYSKTIRHLPPPPQNPNLTVNNQDISVTPVLPTAGSSFDINVTYRNNGSVAITAPYDLELTVIEAGVPRIETRNITTPLNPGSTNSVSLNTSLATDGDHAFRVRLDHTEVITESSEGDNVAQMPLCVDFGISATGGGVWGGSFYVNTVQNLTASIYNHGLFTATNVSVTFYLDNVEIATTTIPTVAPGIQVGSYGVSLPYLFDQVGTFELKAIVDQPGIYTECKEDNNEVKQNFTVNLPAPDLRIFSEYISPSKINPDVNEPITIFVSYDNMGIGDSGPFKARLLVDDVPLGLDIDVPSVPAGEDGTVEVTTPYSSTTAGIRIIRALLDPDNLLTETSKTNNEATRALVVGQAPNLLFSNLVASNACPNDGDDIMIEAQVVNSGDLEASAEVHFFYITESDTIPIDMKPVTVVGKDTAVIQTEWLVINKTYHLYAEIRNSVPDEFDYSDNAILTKLCGGPYYNLFVATSGQGIIKKTPNQTRFEGVQQVEVTAIPAQGWEFMGWQGDATGNTNPLMFDLVSDQNILALFSEMIAPPTVFDSARCDAGTVTLRASGATSAQTYAWYTQPTGGTPVQDLSDSTFVTPVLTDTTSFYVAIRMGASESPRVEVVAIIKPLPAQPAITVTGDTQLCSGQETTLLSAPSGFSVYLWSTAATSQQITVRTAGSYFVRVTDSNGCQSVDSNGVTITEVALPAQPQVTVQGDSTICPEKQESVLLDAPSGFSGYLWSTSESTQQIAVSQAGTFSVQVTDNNGCQSVASLPVQIVEESCSEIIVYNAISANDDPLNSYLRIENIDTFPETATNNLKIFNRWGSLVFEATNYDNVNNRFTGLNRNGDPLPVGTYYYVLEFESGRASMSGYLQLKR